MALLTSAIFGWQVWPSKSTCSSPVSCGILHRQNVKPQVSEFLQLYIKICKDHVHDALHCRQETMWQMLTQAGAPANPKAAPFLPLLESAQIELIQRDHKVTKGKDPTNITITASVISEPLLNNTISVNFQSFILFFPVFPAFFSALVSASSCDETIRADKSCMLLLPFLKPHRPGPQERDQKIAAFFKKLSDLVCQSRGRICGEGAGSV